MENHGKLTNSDESLPEFEFRSFTPMSQESFTENSPADHFFFNGRLLPHAFPATSNNHTRRSSSVTTSEYTSRSNSTSSRSSSTSHSPRSSSYNNNPKPLDLNSQILRSGKSVNTMNKCLYSSPQNREKATAMVTASLYRSYSSQRWLYITPVKLSRGIRVGGRKKKATRVRKKTEGSKVMRWWRRILMAAIFACRECHALERA